MIASQAQLMFCFGAPLHWVPAQLLLLSYKSDADLHLAIKSSSHSLFYVQLCIHILEIPLHLASLQFLVSHAAAASQQSPATSWLRIFPLT